MNIRHCKQCGRPIALMDIHPWIISLDRYWVHINRFGRPKRRVDHAPVVSR